MCINISRMRKAKHSTISVIFCNFYQLVEKKRERDEIASFQFPLHWTWCVHLMALFIIHLHKILCGHKTDTFSQTVIMVLAGGKKPIYRNTDIWWSSDTEQSIQYWITAKKYLCLQFSYIRQIDYPFFSSSFGPCSRGRSLSLFVFWNTRSTAYVD